MHIDTTSQVRSPERVRFRQRIAGPGRRSLAWGLDAVVQVFLLLIVACISGLVGVGLGQGAGTGTLLLLLFFATWFYAAFFEIVLHGRTPGKFVTGLRVVTPSGAPARPFQYILRNLLRGVDFLPGGYGVGVAVMASDERLRRIGDLVAGTVVVDERARRLQGEVELPQPVTEEERRSLPARVVLSRDEQRAVESLLRRRSKLSAGRAEELAGLLAPRLREQGVEAETDERVLQLAYARATGRDREVT